MQCHRDTILLPSNGIFWKKGEKLLKSRFISPFLPAVKSSRQISFQMQKAIFELKTKAKQARSHKAITRLS